ncbi:ArsR/SmtB family transcription factor [Oceanirhabdus seepicola]|uniref:Winged helix-turn-helix transcriptional regulator n=1 Tax=Oceanirhabdus seepicola TaxID=2828781 RepID=A0A9J6P7I2_9CLOT|nr:winged helix-turn-helix domain-containing protein [Oceanirhabdus seepicola]MCM1991480.1 winged helix-turn-helix transcriptional regulator [Oceanirhabdus seepicola]
MKIIINNELGKILDFIYYPYMGRFHNELERNQFFDDIDIEIDECKDLTKDIQKKMKNHYEVIEQFYSQEFNPITLIIGQNILIESNSIEEYLNSALDQDEDTIRKNLLKILMFKIGKKDMINSAVEEEKHKDKDFMLSTVKNTSISPSMKWNMFCAIEDPVKYIQDYVEFMRKIKPEFDKLWIQGEKEIGEYREGFVKKLEKDGIEFLNSIVDDFFDKENTQNTTGVLALSYVCGDMIMIREIEDTMILHWGYKVEEMFSKMKERKEFELEKRLRILKTLGDKTKYKMLKLIAENPEISAYEIINELEVTGATVSYHINLMSTYKILKVTKANKKNSYEIDKSTLEDLIQGIIEDFDLQDIIKSEVE